jgi:ADP-dependent NAD(P)H-hydrate dehydratase
MIDLDREWLDAHPLPAHAEVTDKNARGRVLVVGGAHFVPGALRLTGEAALRAGAGKLQMATVAEAALVLGVHVPEAAMIAVPADENGEIGEAAIPALTKAMEKCDALVIGPGMSGDITSLIATLIDSPRKDFSIVLDAGAISACRDLGDLIRAHEGRAVLTPHHGEMAALTGRSIDDIGDAGYEIAIDTAVRLQATIVLKSDRTIIATPDGSGIHYSGGGLGLATGGSGDVLAGIVGGLSARGAAAHVAAAWGVWMHGEAGRRLSANIGPIGFLARELLAELPGLMAGKDH